MNQLMAIIQFAIILPDWNSLESVRHVHSYLEAAALVFFAMLVLCDVLAHIYEENNKEKLFTKIGLCFFAIAVFAEIIAYPYGQRNDALSEQVIDSLDDKVQQTKINASRALDDSGKALNQANDALSRAGKAQDSLGKAEKDARGAQSAATSALVLAKGAREEADTFEKDIVLAKKQAADAELHLAEATQRTLRLEKQLSWRTITPEQKRTIRNSFSIKKLLPLMGVKIGISYLSRRPRGWSVRG